MGKPAAGSPLLPLEWAAIVGIVLVWGINNIAAKYLTHYIPPFLRGDLGLVWPWCFWLRLSSRRFQTLGGSC